MKTEQYNDVLLVEVPEDAKDFVLDMGYLIFKIQNEEGWVTDDEIEKDVKKFLRTGKSKFWDATNLPPLWKLTGLPMPHGQYTIIGKGDELTDKDWEGITESHDFSNRHDWNRVDTWYKDYEAKGYEWLATPTESGHSLLASKGFSPSTTLIIKKISST